VALAILQLIDKGPGGYAFHVDTGSSPWWELVVGEAVSKQNNAEFVDGSKLRLPLRGPEPNSLKTGRQVQLDPSLFDEEKRFIQLFSYQTRDKKGPSFSPVIEVVSRLRGKSDKLTELPDIRLPKNLSIMTSVQTYNTRRSFSFEETPLSAPMGFAALMPLLSNLLPLAGNLLGGLMNKGGGGGGTAAPAGGGGGGLDLKSLLTPENIKAIADVVIQLMQQNKTAVAKSMSGTVSPALLGLSPAVAPVLGKLMTPEAIGAISCNPQKLYAALADAIVRLPDSELLAVKQELLKLRPLESTLKNPPTPYSEAKIAPALLAALPALMPLAEKALDGIQNMNKEQNRHIEAIIPKGVNMDEALKQMLQSINTYNAISHLQQPAPGQVPIAQSVMVNALCNTIPIVEKALSDNSFEEFREKTEEIVKKVHNEMLELQEELKEKVAKMVPQLKSHDRDETKALSMMASNTRGANGNNIFGHSLANGYNGNAAHVKGIKLLSRVLPAAVATEYRRKKKELRVKSFSLSEPPPDAKPDPAAELLLQKIDESTPAKAQSIPMKESPAYAIEILGSKTTDVNGVAKVLYVKEKGIAFALKLISNTGKNEPLSKAMVQVQIKNHDDSKVVVEKKFPLLNIAPGEMSPLRFEPHELNALPGNCDLLVHISFAWKTKNETKGVRKTHAIMLTDGYVLGRTGDTVKSGIPLNNVNTHRNFWHKVWETSATARSKVHISCRYYMHYNERSAQNGYIETKKLERRGAGNDNEYDKDDLFIKMKSGMDVSPVALNQLLPGLQARPLDEQQLKALRHYEFKKQMDSAAESQLTFRNKEGDTSTLWVYPEVDLFKLTLRKANEVNALGNVLSTVDEEVVFVRPSSIHFIGTKSA
jgi:hypothetical protein